MFLADATISCVIITSITAAFLCRRISKMTPTHTFFQSLICALSMSAYCPYGPMFLANDSMPPIISTSLFNAFPPIGIINTSDAPALRTFLACTTLPAQPHAPSYLANTLQHIHRGSIIAVNTTASTPNRQSDTGMHVRNLNMWSHNGQGLMRSLSLEEII